MVATGLRRLAGELGAALRPALTPVLMPVVRRLPWLVVGIAVCASLLSGFVLLSALWDDAAIDANRGVAVAEVLDGSGGTQTLVRFAAADGRVVIADSGAFYPGGLLPGERVVVEYDTSRPDLVRIAGRHGGVGVLPIALGVVGVWLLALPLAAWLRTQPFTIPGARARAARTQPRDTP